jgi:hypothetical protein
VSQAADIGVWVGLIYEPGLGFVQVIPLSRGIEGGHVFGVLGLCLDEIPPTLHSVAGLDKRSITLG